MDSSASKVVLKMSLTEARSVIWPFRELKGQTIGSLLDKGLLSLQDLGFAAQRAYTERLREASRTILLHQLMQEPLASEQEYWPLNVVSTELRSFAERRQLQLAMLEGLIMGGIFTLLMSGMLWSISMRKNSADNGEALARIYSNPISTIVFVIFMIVLIGTIISTPYLIGKALDHLVLRRIEKQMRLHRKGQLGEERALNVMFGVLDGRWWLFRNMELPGRRLGDLDSVLVGPYGVWSIEVKAYSGEYRNVGEQWEKRFGTKWHSIRKSPTRQARRNAAELSQLLATNQIKQWVTPLIVWANPESTVVLDNPSTSVWTLDQISDGLKDLSSKPPIPEAQVEKIVEVLKKICQDHDDSSST
ncbi:MAG: NERD domain-containing protein [Chloroflexi bacterium]|nr:NERD domain-containing protein [Chloroflexota bacterium]